MPKFRSHMAARVPRPQESAPHPSMIRPGWPPMTKLRPASTAMHSDMSPVKTKFIASSSARDS